MSRCLLWLVPFELVLISASVPHLGPIDLIFKFIKPCDGVDSSITFEVSQKRYNRSTYIVDGDVTSSLALGDELTVELKGSMKKEGGYKPGAFYMKETLCKLLDILAAELVEDIKKAAGVTEDCPYSPGAYKVRDYYFDNTKLKILLPYGEYKMEIFVFYGEDLDSCFEAYYELEPKKVMKI